jgi:hypothetical protein
MLARPGQPAPPGPLRRGCQRRHPEPEDQQRGGHLEEHNQNPGDRDQREGRQARLVEIGDVARLAEALAGVRRTAPEGLAQWRYHGRLVARQLDDTHVVIRADFDYRDSILRQFPETFTVPARYIKHMMIVADLAKGDPGAIEDALEAAWQLQRIAG